MGRLMPEVFNPSCCEGPAGSSGEGDSRSLADKHYREHQESSFVPAVKMGPSRKQITADITVLEKFKDRILGIGGAPTRTVILPIEAGARKAYPIASGVLDYFPDAIAAIAHVSWTGNEQHNPGQPLHWARGKSADEADTMLRHFLERGTIDRDGIRHTAKMAWRALAMLQKELEEGI